MYAPFGESLESQGNLATDKLFTGQRLDGTGLYYYGARYYDPTIGRFISPDTLVQNPANPQTLNRYSYVLNNPLKYVDTSGNIVEIENEDTIMDMYAAGEEPTPGSIIEQMAREVATTGVILDQLANDNPDLFAALADSPTVIKATSFGAEKLRLTSERSGRSIDIVYHGEIGGLSAMNEYVYSPNLRDFAPPSEPPRSKMVRALNTTANVMDTLGAGLGPDVVPPDQILVGLGLLRIGDKRAAALTIIFYGIFSAGPGVIRNIADSIDR